MNMATARSRTRGLSIIVPTYNERENVPELMAKIEVCLKGFDFEIVFVDDESPDGTADLAESLGEKYGNVKVLRRFGRRGLASAVLDGVEVVDSEVVAVIDADLQHPPELLPLMLDRLREGYDIVVASRFVEGGGVVGWTFGRRFVSKVATILAHLLLPKTRTIKDPMSGYFMFRRSVIEGSQLSPRGFKILLEVLVKGRYRSVTEVPYIFKPRWRGKSKLDIKQIWNYIMHLYELRTDVKEH